MIVDERRSTCGRVDTGCVQQCVHGAFVEVIVRRVVGKYVGA